MNGIAALKKAKDYVDETLKGSGALKGKDGKSAYQIAVDNGFVGSKTQWLESLKGKNGINGLNGISPTITPNADNDDETYKLDITDINGTRTTPNLKGKDGGGSGEGGTTDYDKLDNKPSINGVELSGNKTLEELNISAIPGKDGKSAYQIAVDNGFAGDEKQWLESLKGEPGERGEDGCSVTSIRTDDNNYVWVTFSNGKEENIGEFSVNIQADFLTDGGFGKLRYYQNHFQYYDVNIQQWIDTIVTPENVYIVNMTPLPMKYIFGKYDYNIGHYKLKWEEPSDTIIDDQAMCVVDKVVIRRKKDSAPSGINDGDFVVEMPRRNFGSYKTRWYIDESFSPGIGDIYYYKAFPISATTEIYSNSNMNEVALKALDYELYGFIIDQNESDPSSMITYIEDNTIFTPAHMDYDKDEFDYGDWKDAYFMNVRPCMLNYDGTVAYYLNPNDYTFKENGEPSDVANTSFDGNAMVQFPKIYWKIEDNGNNTANVYVCNKKLDDGFYCWSHIDANGNEIDYCYMPIYNGSVTIDRLRSMSGCVPLSNASAESEVVLSTTNNQNGEHIWYTEVFADRQLVNILLLLIGKSTNTQSVFGNGYCRGGSQTTNPRINTGSMNKKGLFWGKNTETMDGVKVFGMEHWWGNQWRRIAGWINANGVNNVKMTYGKDDGSEVNGYNLTGDGYIALSDATSSGATSGVYISSVTFSDKGIIPKDVKGSETTYFTDGLIFTTGGVNYACVGGDSSNSWLDGALCVQLNATADHKYWSRGAAISCKPLAR